MDSVQCRIWIIRQIPGDSSLVTSDRIQNPPVPPAPTDNNVTKLADVAPFRGLRFNQSMIGDLSQVVSPPYDIISPDEQLRYHNKHARNAIRLDFSLDQPGDDASNNRYTRAAQTLKAWLEDGVLLPESEPAVYCLREEYLAQNGVTATRNGLIALVRLTDFAEGIVLPHEETASGPKQDRLNLMEATEANLSPIFCTYQDDDGAIAATLAPALSAPADISLTDEAGTRHSLWVVDEEQVCNEISEAFSGKTLYIADGHHRYETALAYRDARRDADGPGPEQPYDYMMIYLSSMEEAGRSIFPIHRFVSGLSPETMSGLQAALAESFTITELPDAGEDRQQLMLTMMAENSDRNLYGMYLRETGAYYVLVARKPRPMIGSAELGRSAAYRSLDVAVLDRVILSDILGIREGGPNATATVRFVERTDKALAETAGLDFQVAFFVNPTTIEEIKAVSEAGEKMPQKSTYFYPKPLTGLVFRSFLY